MLILHIHMYIYQHNTHCIPYLRTVFTNMHVCIYIFKFVVLMFSFFVLLSYYHYSPYYFNLVYFNFVLFHRLKS